MSVLKCDKEEILKTVLEEYQQLAITLDTTTKEFEDCVGQMISNVASRLMLGSPFDYEQVLCIISHQITKIFKQ